jgi:hypothetical protein
MYIPIKTGMYTEGKGISGNQGKTANGRMLARDPGKAVVIRFNPVRLIVRSGMSRIPGKHKIKQGITIAQEPIHQIRITTGPEQISNGVITISTGMLTHAAAEHSGQIITIKTGRTININVREDQVPEVGEGLLVADGDE